MFEVANYYSDEDLEEIDRKFASIKEKLPLEAQSAYEDKFYELVYLYNQILENRDEVQEAAKKYNIERNKVLKKIKYHTDKSPDLATKKEMAVRFEYYEMQPVPRVTKKYLHQFFEDIKLIFFVDKEIKSPIKKREIEYLINLI